MIPRSDDNIPFSLSCTKGGIQSSGIDMDVHATSGVGILLQPDR